MGMIRTDCVKRFMAALWHIDNASAATAHGLDKLCDGFVVGMRRCLREAVDEAEAARDILRAVERAFEEAEVEGR